MNDLPTLILIGIIVVAVILLIQRLMRQQQSPYSTPGQEKPHYDDPNINSHGGFGGTNQNQGQFNRPQHDNPNIESHGSFGHSGGSASTPSASRLKDLATGKSQKSTVSEKTGERTGSNDDPNVSSHGGFGGK